MGQMYGGLGRRAHREELLGQMDSNGLPIGVGITLPLEIPGPSRVPSMLDLTADPEAVYDVLFRGEPAFDTQSRELPYVGDFDDDSVPRLPSTPGLRGEFGFAYGTTVIPKDERLQRQRKGGRGQPSVSHMPREDTLTPSEAEDHGDENEFLGRKF